MTEPAIKLFEDTPAREDGRRKRPAPKAKNAKDIVDDTYTEELFIGLCGPIGSPFTSVKDKLEELLKDRGYSVEYIKVSQLLRLCMPADFEGRPRLEQKKALIAKGDELCDRFGSEFLAEYVITRIAEIRAKQAGEEGSFTSLRKCYIIDSLKRTQEQALLKKAYGDAYYLIGVYCTEDERLDELAPAANLRDAARGVMEADFNGGSSNGQNIKSLFPRSDYFIHGTSSSKQNQNLDRFLDLIFGTALHSPRDHERAMFAAWGAGLSSACMSRQVGACVTSRKGDVIGLGWNEVPKKGGGVYKGGESSHSGGTEDRRCFSWKPDDQEMDRDCRNDWQKQLIIKQAAKAVGTVIKNQARELSAQIKDQTDAVTVTGLEGAIKAIGELIEGNPPDGIFDALAKTRLGQLIEFSRSVHAELNALFDALKNAADAVNGGRVYVTTYPCHNCARHIVLAGIDTVYFIEPYPKSLALQLHSDSITHSSTDPSKVQFLAYEGISPGRYNHFFTTGDRELKINGRLSLPSKVEATNRHKTRLSALYDVEKKVYLGYSPKFSQLSVRQG